MRLYLVSLGLLVAAAVALLAVPSLGGPYVRSLALRAITPTGFEIHCTPHSWNISRVMHDGPQMSWSNLAGVAMAVLVVDICWSSIDWSRRAAPARVRE